MLRAFVFILTAAFAANAQTVESAKVDAAPISVGLVVDNSGSYRLLLDRVIQLVADIVDQKNGEDEVFLVTFVDTSKIVLRQPLTYYRSELHDAAEEMFIEGGATAIIDALNFAAKQFEKSTADRPRALLLISDGDERNSAAKIEDVIRTLRDAKIRVYAIGLADDRLYSKLLDRITKETGGAKFIPKTRSETADIVKQVWPAMRTGR